MKIYASKGGGDFQVAPAGAHIARCYRIVDLGTQKTEWKGEIKHTHKLMLSWELCNEKMADGRPFTVSKRYTSSMNEKATLRKHLRGWRGKEFSGQINGFDISAVLGKPCMLSITHTDGEKVYANVDAVMPLPAGMNAPTLFNEPVAVFLNPDEFSADAFSKLTPGLQELISATPEYKTLFADSADTYSEAAEEDF